MKFSWKEEKLGSLVKFSSGGTPNKNNPSYWNGSIPWISAKNMKSEVIGTSDLTITEEGLIHGSKIAPKGSLLLLVRGSGLFNGIPVCYLENAVAYNQDVKCIESTSELENKYLFYWLKANSSYLRKKLEFTSIGAGKFDTRFLSNLVVRFPDKATRKRIIDIADNISDRININKKINENLYQQVVALYGLLFGKATQQITSVGQYSEQIYSGGTPSTSKPDYWNGEFHWFSSGETRNRFAITTDKTITTAGVNNSSTKLAHKYDIVMASAGQGFTRGQTTMLLLDTYVNQSVIVIHANRTVIPYLFWNLASRYDELRAISDSSSIRGSLTTKMIAGFEIPEVDSASLAIFSDFAWSVISEIENNLLENERLSTLRDALLPRLMSGELDVSGLDL